MKFFLMKLLFSKQAIMNEVLFLEKINKRSYNDYRFLNQAYNYLLKDQLTNGDIESAILTVIRANRSLQVESLAVAPNFNIRLAHIVKAGIAADKLLESGGMAQLMISQGEMPMVSAPSKIKRLEDVVTPKEGRIIPFPGDKT